MNVTVTHVPGGWSIADMTPCNLPQKAASAFSATLESITGAGYEPVLYCGQQVVNGVNYGIICKQTIPAPFTPYEHLVFAALNESPNGEYAIASITPII